MSRSSRFRSELIAVGVFLCRFAFATPEFVEHLISDPVFGEGSAITGRSPLNPREDEAVSVWIRIGYSFYYTNVAVYYTVDGSEPGGSKGVPSGSASVVLSGGGLEFVRNQTVAGGTVDWWRATLPATTRQYSRTIKYRIGAWHSGGGPEVFANNYGCSDGVCNEPNETPTTFSYTVAIAWPGKGSPAADHAVGYPPVHFWKEEGVVGNNYMNVQLDQNGTVYDVYYPSAGAVQGMGTKNEGYVDGLDTFPPGLPLGSRGQMNLNQAMAGLRVGGSTYWLSNRAGGDFVDYTQSYVSGTNILFSSSRLVANGANIRVDQYDFCPAGIVFPSDMGGTPNRGIYAKRYLLTNNAASAQSVGFYYYADTALNGGDSYDRMFFDGTAGRGAMVAYDNVLRNTSTSGEYNPTTFGDYTKNVSVYLATTLKVCDAVGGATGSTASESWRLTSGDEGQGWIGQVIILAPGQTREVDVVLVGGFDAFANATGTYAYQIAPALDWFAAANMANAQAATESYWRDWLDEGTTVDLSDARYNELFERSLLATALHIDAKGGGVVAGMHNGAYPYVWPRDAVYAAITLARTGHFAESAAVYAFLKNVAYRANDVWGKGFWYQKYTTDGYLVWSAPQVDETAAVPWGAMCHYDATGDLGFLNSMYPTIYEAGRAGSEDSSIDGRLYYDDPNKLMHSNNVWEDSFDDFLYSNASVERGLRDAAAAATILGHSGDAAIFTQRANDIHQGMIGRLLWDGENTDVSQLGLAYPFSVFAPDDPKMGHVVDRMNGVAGDRNGFIHPIVNFTGEWQGLVNRYWGDTYWNGGPWFLSTLWYGLYYAARADVTPGPSDIDNHKSRLDLCIERLGPLGLGAEQIAPSNSLLYPGQTDFTLQAAWPNAWESMSTFVDAVMAFLGFVPDAQNSRFTISPKLPSDWNQMTFSNLRVSERAFTVVAENSASDSTATIANQTGGSLTIEAFLRIPIGAVPHTVTRNGTPAGYTFDTQANRVRVETQLLTGVGSTTRIQVTHGAPTVTVNATVRLNAWIGNAIPISTIPVLVSIDGGGETTIHLSGAGDIGSFTVQVPSTGPHTIRVKPTGFLSQRQSFTTSGAPVSLSFLGPFGLGLFGGDTDGSNEVDDADLTSAILDYGMSGGLSGFTDLNGDGEVDDADLTLTILAFGMTGQP